MLTNRQRQIVGCVVLLTICAAAVAPPAQAFPAESEIMGAVGVGDSGAAFGLGAAGTAVGAWLEVLWSHLASFWAMDGAKIMEGG